MNTLGRRLDALEATTEEARLRGMAATAGCPLDDFRREVREITPTLAAWRAAGLTERQILERIVREVTGDHDVTDDEFREALAEAERFTREELPRWR